MDYIEQALKTRKVQDVLNDNELFVEFIKGQPDWLEMAPGIITELMEAYNNLWCDAVYETAGESCVACGKSCTKNGVTWVDDTGHCVDCAPSEDDDIDESFCDGCQEYRDAFCQHEDCDLCVNCCGGHNESV